MNDRSDSRPTPERRALRLSILSAGILGAVAMARGVVAESRVLLFDGVFMLLGILLSGISLLAAAASSSAPTRNFPFGKRAATPLAIGVQGAALLGTLVYAAVDAVLVIRGGGVQVAPGAVLLYGVISMVASLVVTWRMRRTSDSDLVAAEAAQWKAGAWLSAVIGTGGLVALVLDGTSWDSAVPFADPVLVLIACLVITPVPFRMLRDAGLELLEAAPSPTVQHEISASVRDAQEAFGLPDPHVAATKLGDRLYLEVVFVVGEGWAVSEEDAVRHAIIDRLEPLGYDVWANVELTTDAGLVE